jgi:hypothetical protein
MAPRDVSTATLRGKPRRSRGRRQQGDGEAPERGDTTRHRDGLATTFPSQSVGALLVFHVMEHPKGLTGHVAYDDYRMRAEDAGFIARAFERFLVALSDRASSRLSSV